MNSFKFNILLIDPLNQYTSNSPKPPSLIIKQDLEVGNWGQGPRWSKDLDCIPALSSSTCMTLGKFLCLKVLN